VVELRGAVSEATDALKKRLDASEAASVAREEAAEAASTAREAEAGRCRLKPVFTYTK